MFPYCVVILLWEHTHLYFHLYKVTDVMAPPDPYHDLHTVLIQNPEKPSPTPQTTFSGPTVMSSLSQSFLTPNPFSQCPAK